MPTAKQNYWSKNLVAKVPLPVLFILVFEQASFAGTGSVPGFSTGNSIYGGPGTSTFRNPLVPGAEFGLPGIPVAPGAPPPIGSGMVPLPVTPGMIGPPSLIPWANGTAGNQMSMPTNQVVVPANQINVPDSRISLPMNNSTFLPPGALNAVVGGSIPVAPSTPGEDPGMLRPPSFYNGSAGSNPGQNYQSAAGLTSNDINGQYPVGAAPTTRPRYPNIGMTSDYGLSQKTEPAKQYYGYRLEFTMVNGQPTSPKWVGKQGSYTQDFGLSLQQLQKSGKLGSKSPYQISYDAPANAQYPGGQSNAGQQLNQNSRGNHDPYNYGKAIEADAAEQSFQPQVTNDLYGVPMINSNRILSDGLGGQASPIPLTTIAPY